MRFFIVWTLKRPIYVYYMPAKRRSGFANDIRAYKCSPPIYTVIYNGNTNTSGYFPTDKSSPYVVGSTVTVLGNSGSPALAKSGFTFTGWNTAANGSGTSYSQGNTFVITANITLYARWTPLYTVTYNGNNNDDGNVPIDSSSPYVSGLNVTVLGNSGSSALTRSGFAFAGWNTAANGSGISYSPQGSFVITANTTLYARWTPTYTVNYDGNTSTGGNVPTNPSLYVSGSTVTVLGNSGSPVLEKPGYAFSGWNTASNGAGTSYSQGNTFVITSDTTLYAQWTLTYTVTYNGNTSTGGNVPTSPSLYVSGSMVTVLGNSGSPVLSKSGFAFAGWNTEENGSGTSYSQGNQFAITANTTLYARWTPVTYTVTYNGNTNTSGNVRTDSSSPYAYGSNVTVLGNTGSPVLAKTGFTFAGWNTKFNGSGTSYSPQDEFSITANTILFAQWAIIPTTPSTPILSLGVGGNQAAYILFTQSGSVTNYEYSTDNGNTFRAFDPPQIYSPVEINTLSSDGTTRLTNTTQYTVKLKAVNSGFTSGVSNSVNVTPQVTSLVSTDRLIYLDANNSSSYSGTGTVWTNLVSNGSALNATLNGSPTFDNTTDPSNSYFEFNPDSLTGQFAQINQAYAINPRLNEPFTIQMWVRINNIGSQGSLVSKVFGASSYDGYALGYIANTTLQLHENGNSLVNYFSSDSGVLSSEWVLYTANVQFGNGGGILNKVFVNGRQVLSETSNETGIPSNTQNLTFPRGFYGEGECDIGQFYYYDTELSVTQVIQNYDASKPRYL